MNEELRQRLIALLSDLTVGPDEYMSRVCVVCECFPCSGCEREALLAELEEMER